MIRRCARAALGMGLVVLALAPTAGAQSAADKGTARQLAGEGVELFRSEKWAEALDRMQRAQALFDAPVHLLYIARAQVKLGQLVEGAETYQRLIRTSLGADAPAAFKDAVNEGRKELPDVQARIPKLRIEVEPAGAAELSVKLDDAAVPPAALGVERLTNPGEHTVVATARGYKVAEVKVALAEAATETVRLTLVVDPTAATTPPPEGDGEPRPGAAEESSSKLGFVLSARLLGMSPRGVGVRVTNSTRPAPDDQPYDVPIKDLFGAGGGLELRGGLRFNPTFTVHVVAGGYGFKPGPDFDQPFQYGTDVSERTSSQGVFSQFGLGGTMAFPVGGIHLLGELDLMLVHDFTVTRTVTFQGGRTCEETWNAGGTALRLAAGASFPLSDSFALSPLAGLSIGTVSELTQEGCGRAAVDVRKAASQDIVAAQGDVDYPAHLVLFLGVGLDWLIGGK
ncbi:MAG: hypothetical protein KF718_11950 [Polyangiaceae bacterium]|nr:hypothetical protein [Polyangiaceae bacterium]